jgi:transcriptional regulator with XRE-family HTH domain
MIRKFSFGRKLKIARIACGWNQTELAKRCKMTQKRISKYECDFVEPDITSLCKLANVLCVKLEFLLEDWVENS